MPAAAGDESPTSKGEDVMELPMIMTVKTLTRADKEKVRRICTPKPTSGRVEVPKDIVDMWNSDKGREKLLQIWCKSGGVKVGLTAIYNFLLTWLLYCMHAFNSKCLSFQKGYVRLPDS